MPARHRWSTSNADLGSNLFLNPAIAASMWNPVFAAVLNGGAQAQEGFGSIASECQSFVGHRLQEDIALMQRLAQCSTPDQVWSAYAHFWHKAAEDYGQEFSTMAKLMQGVTNKMGQAFTEGASEQSPPSRRAA